MADDDLDVGTASPDTASPDTAFLATEGTGYPPHWEADVLLADGGIVHLRPIAPADSEALVAFHAGLSVRTRYLRFFFAYPTVPARDLLRFTQVDYHDRVALVAVRGSRIVAVGRYDREPGTDAAEVAFVVADAEQGRGIGSMLLEHLAAAGRERGLRRFTAVLLAENRSMLRVFTDAGYVSDRHFEGGEVSLSFQIGETAVTDAVARDRERRSEAASIARLLRPRSVVVIGASNERTKVGGVVFGNLVRAGFHGSLYPVNHGAGQVDGVSAYPSVLDVPAPVDLAVVAVPRAAVAAVVEQCAQRDVRGLVLLSGGFGERGDQAERAAGWQAQRALVRSARAQGMRVVGPNCLGIANTAPEVSLNASLAPLAPLAGRAGFFCQSGALGMALLGEAARRGLGVSTFVSAGNRADVSGNDLLQFWQDDPGTDLALLYLESFGNPRKFARLARRFGRRKPIVAVKSGRNSVVAGLQHTSADVPETTVQALFEASGVIRVDTVDEMFDVALLLLTQPLPAGSRVTVIGNSTALAVLVADACATEVLSLVRVIDVGADATPAQFRAGLNDALCDGAPERDADAVLAVFVPPVAETSGEPFAEQLRAASAGATKPVLSTFLGFDGVPTALAQPGSAAPTPGSVPSYPSPERAVRALARACRYARWRSRPELPPALPTGIDAVPARELVAGVLRETPGGRQLTPAETATLLGDFGIPVAASRPNGSLAGASGHIAVPRGIDTVFGLVDDRSFGALVSFGVGGVATDLLGDRAFAVVPLTTADADDLIAAPKAAPLVTGWGGATPADRAALADLALRLSGLAEELPEVVSCDLAPVVATPTGAHVLAARARVAPPAARPDTGPRRLRGL